MDPGWEGYISLEEETTSASSHDAASLSEGVPLSPTSTDEDVVQSDGSSAEMVEAGVPEEQQTMVWVEASGTPRMPPKRSSTVEQLHTSCASSSPPVDRQLQVPPRGIEHEEFCRDMNGMTLPHDHAERKNFDQLDNFILGDPAACFDRPCGHSLPCVEEGICSYPTSLWLP